MHSLHKNLYLKFRNIFFINIVNNVFGLSVRNTVFKDARLESLP